MPNYPVIVGVGQLTNRIKSLDQAVEPAELMARAARAAAVDAGSEGLLAQVDTLEVVSILSWQYPDAPGLLAQKLGIDPAKRVYTAVGGDTPQKLVNEVSEAIVNGTVRFALLAGAEAMASRNMARKQEAQLPWKVRGTPESVVGDTRAGFSDVEARHGAVAPIRVYPLFENAIRAHLGQSIDEHQQYVAELASRFTQVAAQNPCAWFPVARTPEEIRTVTPENRWVCFPYPKRMNAIMEVDQGAAVLLTGSETAKELGIPEEKWVYVHGCGQANDKWLVSDRVNYHSSPAIKAATGRALSQAGLSVDDIDFFDLYSCFPSAVQMGLDALGLATTEPRDITVTGGLPYFGGAGNNYVMHSIATTVERLRANPEQRALVTGLGWFATKHSAGVYSGRPPQGEWRRSDPAIDQAAVDSQDSPRFVAEANGPATVETYTVAFGRGGEPEMGIVIGRLGDGSRFFANTPVDSALLWSMTKEEFVGRAGRVEHDAAAQKNILIVQA
jgi:acetyl-CoA C-acetyltransferase